MKKEIICDIDYENIKNLDNHSLFNACRVAEDKIKYIHKKRPCIITKEHIDFYPDLLFLFGDDSLSKEDKSEKLINDTKKIISDLKIIKPLFKEEKDKDIFEQIFALMEFIEERFLEFLSDRYSDRLFWKSDIKKLLISYIEILKETTNYKYNIINNMNDCKNDSYNIIINLDIREPIFIPPVLNDSIRDLFSNSRKYSPIGSTIIIKIEKTEEYIYISIKDNGYGIPEDEIEHVVKEGYRASNMKHRPTMGGGFGLTKAYAVCKKYGGRFWIDSEVNKGTEIIFSIKNSNKNKYLHE